MLFFRYGPVVYRNANGPESVSFRRLRVARPFEAETFSRPGGES
jgi:hypothetical protein